MRELPVVLKKQEVSLIWDKQYLNLSEVMMMFKF